MQACDDDETIGLKRRAGGTQGEPYHQAQDRDEQDLRERRSETKQPVSTTRGLEHARHAPSIEAGSHQPAIGGRSVSAPTTLWHSVPNRSRPAAELVAAQAVQELLHVLFGPEHVQCRMRAVLRDERACLLGL